MAGDGWVGECFRSVSASDQTAASESGDLAPFLLPPLPSSAHLSRKRKRERGKDLLLVLFLCWRRRFSLPPKRTAADQLITQLVASVVLTGSCSTAAPQPRRQRSICDICLFSPWGISPGREKKGGGRSSRRRRGGRRSREDHIGVRSSSEETPLSASSSQQHYCEIAGAEQQLDGGLLTGGGLRGSADKKMLACIACSTKDGGDDGHRSAATPNGRDAGKSLTSQLKDMVLKFSGTGRHQYKAGGSPSLRSSRFHRSSRLAAYPGIIDESGFTSDGTGEAYTYTRTMASAGPRAAPPTWDLPKVNHRSFQPSVVRSPIASGIPSIGDEDEEEDVVLQEDRVPREWTAQVEPGVQITFVSIPGGAGNDLKRIRFSREMFNKWEAQRWWGENYDRVVELYNVQMFSRQQGLSTPTSSVDDAMQESFYSRAGSTRESPVMMMPPSSDGREHPITRTTSCKAPPKAEAGRAPFYPSTAVPDPSDHVWAHHFNLLNSAAAAAAGASTVGAAAPYDPSRGTTSSRDEASVSVSNASDLEATEWVEQDEPGVCITIRELGDGTRELRRVRFSRERFGEERAKVWWEQNRDRIHAQYL